jgi:Rad3-related DNA helicase
LNIVSYMFACPKCGRLHTKEEYMDSRFCRECGKFLAYRNKVVAPSQGWKTRSREWALFPYKPYQQQLKFMRDIKNVMSNQGILVAEACNGFGKTVCALASILPLDRKIVYATRTHEQVRQVLLEVERINGSSGKMFSAVNLASRRHLCLNEKCKRLTAVDAMEVCRLLKESDQCPYRTEIDLQSLALPSVLSIRKLRRLGRNKRVCPYFLARKSAGNCTVVVAPYQYVFNEHIRRRIGLNLNSKVLVFDEAHNADQIGQEVLSVTLSERTLSSAKRELEATYGSTEFIDQLAAHIDKKISDDTTAELGTQLRADLEKVLGVKKLSSFASEFSDLVEEIQIRKMERGDNPVCFLNGVLRFLEHVDSSPSESYITVYRKSSQGLDLMEYRCLDPSLAIKPVVEQALGTLIISGTLSPLDLFTEILGLEDAETRTYSAIADPENVRTIIDLSVTTRFSERSEDMFHRYGTRLSKLIDKIPNGVLVFFPQRKLMLTSLNHWRKIGIIEHVSGQAFLTGKVLFVEGARAAENRKVVEEYKIAAKSRRGAVLCGVFRGRNAEGSNFPYEEARGVVLIGVPFADYSDPVVKAQIGFFNRERRGMGERWYVMDALRAANQALGRGIRHRDDWCNFILMDSRYQTYQKLISEWAVANGIHEIS